MQGRTKCPVKTAVLVGMGLFQRSYAIDIRWFLYVVDPDRDKDVL